MSRSEKKKYSKRMTPEARRTLIIEVAADLFYRKGFFATSLDDIISKAGGSKRTIYTEFGGKKELYKAVLIEKKEDFFAFSLEYPNTDLRTALVDVGEELLKKMLAPTVTSAIRVALRDCLQFPQIAKIHFESKPGEITAYITMILERAAQKKEIYPQNFQLAAHNFTDMIFSRLYWQVIYKLRPNPTSEDIRKYVETMVDFFLNGVRGIKQNEELSNDKGFL